MTRAELRALLAAATPGPWGWRNLDALHALEGAHDYGRAVLVVGTDDDGASCIKARWLDRDLICAAKNALPALLTALDHAEEALDRLGNRPHKPSQVDCMEQVARDALARIREVAP